MSNLLLAVPQLELRISAHAVLRYRERVQAIAPGWCRYAGRAASKALERAGGQMARRP